MLSYFAVAQNDSIGRMRYNLLEVRNICSYPRLVLLENFAFFYICGILNSFFYISLSFFNLSHVYSFIQKMLQPCGPPPAKDEEDDGES